MSNPAPAALRERVTPQQLIDQLHQNHRDVVAKIDLALATIDGQLARLAKDRQDLLHARASALHGLPDTESKRPNAQRSTREENKLRIRAALADGQVWQPSMLAVRIGASVAAVQGALVEMVTDGEAEKAGWGLYRRVEVVA